MLEICYDFSGEGLTPKEPVGSYLMIGMDLRIGMDSRIGKGQKVGSWPPADRWAPDGMDYSFC
jgi:hypothetical protein